MAIGSCAVRTSNATTNLANTELIASTRAAFKAMECGISLAIATTAVFGMGVPAAIGTTPTTPAALTFEDGGNTSTCETTSALAWGTSPTNPTVYSRRVSLQALIGAGIVWTFPRGFAVLKAKSLTTSNIGTTTTADVWWVVDE